jgi:hypothetical protein
MSDELFTVDATLFEACVRLKKVQVDRWGEPLPVDDAGDPTVDFMERSAPTTLMAATGTAEREAALMTGSIAGDEGVSGSEPTRSSDG